LFYSAELSLRSLLVATCSLVVLFVLNRLKVDKAAAYILLDILGAGWLAVKMGLAKLTEGVT
jgi:Na+/H+ antiporter NhaA